MKNIYFNNIEFYLQDTYDITKTSLNQLAASCTFGDQSKPCNLTQSEASRYIYDIK